MNERIISEDTLAQRGGFFTPLEPAQRSYAPPHPNLPVHLPDAATPAVLSPELPPTHEPTPPRRGNNRILYGLAAAALLAGGWVAERSGGSDSPAATETPSASPSAHAATHHGHHTQPPKNTQGTKKTMSGGPSGKSRPATLLPLPANFVYPQAPGCTDINVEFANQGRQVQSILPGTWEFTFNKKDLQINDPYEATGKLAGSMTLRICLTDRSAIQPNIPGSKRSGKAVSTIDMSKATVTPVIDNLQNGIALAKVTKKEAKELRPLLADNPGVTLTQLKLWKVLQESNPKATVDDAVAVYGMLQNKTTETQVEERTLLSALAMMRQSYQQPIINTGEDIFETKLLGQIPKPYDPASALIVPNVSVRPKLVYNINYPSAKDLAGHFTPATGLAPARFSVVVTDANGKQLKPEAQP